MVTISDCNDEYKDKDILRLCRYHVLEDGAGGYLLEVPSAEWPDEGEWKCVATSSGGRIGISTCYVTMDGKVVHST